MSERARRPRVALCAAITFDGKLDAASFLPPTLLAALAPAAGDGWLADAATARKLPSDSARPTRIIRRADTDDLPRALGSSPTGPPVRRWLCPGGPGLFRALLDAGLVNDLYLLVRPRVDGRRSAPTLSGPPTPEFFPRSILCRLRRMEVVDGECFLHYTIPRQRSHNPPPTNHHAS